MQHVPKKPFKDSKSYSKKVAGQGCVKNIVFGLILGEKNSTFF